MALDKHFIFRLPAQGGRNHQGLITAPRRGNLARKKYRFLDLHREQRKNLPALIIRLLYDANRSAPLALLFYPAGCFTYIILTEGQALKDKCRNLPPSFQKKVGLSFRLQQIPSGSLIHSLSTGRGLPAQYLRSAGVSAILVRHQNHGSLLKMKSGEYRYFSDYGTAVLGTVAGGHHFLRHWIKAGLSRHFSFRPRNRAYARNPVDHPMGGRTKGGTIRKTPKGRPCLNTSTVPLPGPFTIIKKRQLAYRTI